MISSLKNKPFLISAEFKIRAYDIDVMNIVSNIVYIRWFEDLRTIFLDEHWPLETMLDNNTCPVLAKTEIDYKFPLTIKDKPVGYSWVSEFGRAKWVMEHEIYSGDKLYCKGKQTGYVVDLERKRPIALPLHLREKFENSGNQE